MKTNLLKNENNDFAPLLTALEVYTVKHCKFYTIVQQHI